jgi:hypothetical protein
MAACWRATLSLRDIFEVQEHRIAVIACFHGKRNPKRWQAR